ncbi:hypothetical protein GCM10011352_23170 [Marinobacterium zhoushanense]|uniref:Aspartate carbamoyltransferase n=1 Tax=Marinobacterium zhoushanense TaxID=1679163 RepID=A0ABQ1KG52_9GAMM|nr:hypothetical protein [Marinobacterium zhoushanense]GGB96415.1 hypothetical protein GCM10011352_23170 [Marinobacterium zhoushanense]
MNTHVNLCLRLVAAGLLTVALAPAYGESTPQQHVHQMSHHVMPFDIAGSVHLFKMTEQGGRQRVVLREGQDEQQVALIQRHLKHEAMRFAQGDYGDPATLHGADMPGLKELADGASSIRVTYAPLPNGAEIQFETDDLSLLTAIHRWFGAQLSEHGADAHAE